MVRASSGDEGVDLFIPGSDNFSARHYSTPGCLRLIRPEARRFPSSTSHFVLIAWQTSQSIQWLSGSVSSLYRSRLSTPAVEMLILWSISNFSMVFPLSCTSPSRPKHCSHVIVPQSWTSLSQAASLAFFLSDVVDSLSVLEHIRAMIYHEPAAYTQRHRPQSSPPIKFSSDQAELLATSPSKS